MKIRVRFRESIEYEAEIDWPDDRPLPEVGSDGTEDGAEWFRQVESIPEWSTACLKCIDFRELTSTHKESDQ